MTQRMAYFDEPVRMVKLLAAERLLGQLAAEDRNAAVQVIIRATVAGDSKESSRRTGEPMA